MRCLFAVLLLLAIARPALAEVLVIGSSEYPPFEYLHEGRVVGADTELVEAVVRRMGYEPRARLLPWARTESEAARGRIDIVYSLTWSEERAGRYHFSDPISETRDVFFKRRDRPIAPGQLDALVDYRIGFSAAYQYAPQFMRLLETGTLRVERIYGHDSDLRGLHMLAHGRIDLFLCDLAVCGFHLRAHLAEEPAFAALDHVDRVIGTDRVFRTGFPRRADDPALDRRALDLRDRFNRALAGLPSGEKAAIRRRYHLSAGS